MPDRLWLGGSVCAWLAGVALTCASVLAALPVQAADPCSTSLVVRPVARCSLAVAAPPLDRRQGPATGPMVEDRPAAEERPADPWIARDKVQHLAISFMWSLSVQYGLETKAGWTNRRALPVSIGSGALLGISKELYDWRWGPRRAFSRRDLVADGVGLLLATAVIVL